MIYSFRFAALTILPLAIIAASSATESFAYDRAAPLALRERSAEQRDGAVLRDITFDSGGVPVTAYLVEPAAPGPHAAVLFVHWFGDPRSTNRTQFLDEAFALAKRGVVSLLVDAMWSKAGWWEARRAETDFAEGARQVVALRRALDLLAGRPGVDARRLALVGHDFGAMFGIVAGLADGRPITYVLMAPTPRLSDWYLFNAKPAAPEDYRRQLAPLDPVEALRALPAASVYLQLGLRDKYVPKASADELVAATRTRHAASNYDVEHDLVSAQVVEDRGAWLAKELGLR